MGVSPSEGSSIAASLSLISCAGILLVEGFRSKGEATLLRLAAGGEVLLTDVFFLMVRGSTDVGTSGSACCTLLGAGCDETTGFVGMEDGTAVSRLSKAFRRAAIGDTTRSSSAIEGFVLSWASGRGGTGGSGWFTDIECAAPTLRVGVVGLLGVEGRWI